jgi:uncharacterized protein YfaS (alpha-2-macroglobulin family)
MLDSWRANQKMLSNNFVTGGASAQLTQAFRLVALALARDPDLGAMNRLRETTELPGLAGLMLAAAFHMTGQADAAADLAELSRLEFKPYRDDSETFGSDFRDKALAVRAFVQMGRSEKARSLLEDISKTLSSDLWLSTHETSFGLMALAAYYGSAEIKLFRYRLAWDGERPLDVESSTPFDRREFPGFPMKGRTLAVTNTETSPLYVNVYRRGVPPAGVETESSEGLSIDVRYRDMKMNAFGIDKITQGLDLVAEVRVKNMTSRRLKNLVLTHLTAAGFQIKNPRFGGEAGAVADVDYQDIRDDRLLIFANLSPGNPVKFYYSARAICTGEFKVPPVAAECMYNPLIAGAASSGMVTITK